LTDALHARPASLFVRVASMHGAAVEVRKDGRRADGKNILEVLALGAGKGERIEIDATGEDAQAALTALAALVERNFDADLVPETGTPAAPGMAIGRAVLVDAPLGAEENGDAETGPDASARLATAFAQVRRDLEQMVRTLPPREAELFEPEIAIAKALEAPALARVARGERIDRALRDEIAAAAPAGAAMRNSDLVADVRDRLLDAYRDEGASRLAHVLARAAGEELILVAETLTPSLVAALPERVVGIVAGLAEENAGSSGGHHTSHAAILARGRGIPLVYALSHVVAAIAEGEMVVLDATAEPSRIWVMPSEARIASAREALAEQVRTRVAEEARWTAPLSQLLRLDGMPFAVRVNIGSIHEGVPKGAEGIGLVRTELFFSSRSRPPSAQDQLAMLLLVAGKVAREPIVARLFDAGGDKPLAWLTPPEDAPDLRGFDLLRRHPEVLRAQIGAMARAAERADVRVLIPLVQRADDVDFVRSLLPAPLAVGAMIESPDAARAVDEIAAVADFVCIGTNDLAAFVRGEDRAHALAAPQDPRVLALVRTIVEAAHRHRRHVTVCGEIAGDPETAVILAGLGVDAVSVAPSRFAAVKGALAATSGEACRDAAERAIAKESAP
jgi:phosphotransferase system HPr (HPr) family protein